MHRRSVGFTLIEMLVVLAVVAILATVAVPGMGNILATSQVNSAQEDMMQMLRKARSLALGRGATATVVISSADKNAVLSLADGSVVNGTATSETVSFPAVSVNADASFQFKPNGSASRTVGAGAVVLSSASYSSATPARSIAVSAAGQVTVTR